MKKISIISLAAAFLFACEKDNDTNCSKTVENISGTYKLTALTYKENATAPEVDYLPISFPDACERDNLYVFNSNGIYQLQDAGLSCVPSDTYEGTWSLNGNTIEIDGDPATIESFDCSKLTVVGNDEMIPGDIIKLTLTKQ
jgi:hypothetical protein